MKNLKEYINSVIEAFDVGTWEKEINFTKESGNADMMVDHRYKRFTLQIHKGFFDQDIEYQANTIIHEFCHLFNLPLANLVADATRGKLVTPNHMDDVLENANVHAEKVVVSLLFDNSLKTAYKKYMSQNKLRSTK